jgi:serine/threonine-protein kinase RsbW
MRVRTDHNSAFLLVRELGKDLADLVRFRQHSLFCQRIDCIYLDLPLSDPAAADFCAQLEALGFFFGGILPEYSDGDVLRLQCLNNLAIDPQQIELASDFGKELLAYVLKARAAAPQMICN